MACPFRLAAFQHGRRNDVFLIVVAAFLVLLVGMLFAIPVAMPDPGIKDRSAAKFSRWAYLRSPAAIVLEILFFVYVGTESAIGIWLASYAKRANGTQTAERMTAPSYFYGALFLGRVTAPLILKRVPDSTYARLSALASNTNQN